MYQPRALFFVVLAFVLLLPLAQSQEKRSSAAQNQNPSSSNGLPSNEFIAARTIGSQDGSSVGLRSVEELLAQAQSSGSARVIVGLRVAFRPESKLSRAELQNQRNLIARAQTTLLNRLAAFKVTSVKRYSFIPFLAMDADADALRLMQRSAQAAEAAGVVSIEEDVMRRISLAESVPLIGAPAAWSVGFSGAGQAVAILDTGVDKTHPFLSGKVVSEACYSTSSSATTSVCPGGASSSTAAGAGVNCGVAGCEHGTHVAGIAAGKSATFSGVARDANIVAIQVFSRVNGCTSSVDCTGAFDSDILRGLERVQSLSGSLSIAAVNLSLGGGAFTENCDAKQTAFKAAIDSLKSAGIATVIASGNDGNPSGLSSPACISSAISVGSSGDGSGGSTANAVSSFSNSSSFLSLLAPGEYINSSVPGGGFSIFRGTSMAAPHVAGTWAVLKSKSPTATVPQILSALAATGQAINDTRNNVTKPRIKVDAAVGALSAGSCSFSLAPTTQSFSLSGGTGTVNVTATAGCAWMATSSDPWLTVTSGSNGSGNGTVSYSVAANTGLPRAGTLLIAGQVFMVPQAGVAFLGVDDGSQENAIGLARGGTFTALNRLTPSSYPVTINTVAIYFPAGLGLSAGHTFTLLAGTNSSGSSGISSPSYRVSTSAVVQSIGKFNLYSIPGVTITSGDFLIGMRISHSSGVLPAAIDIGPPSQRRSYISTNDSSFTIIDDIGAGFAGNFMFRALPTQSLTCPAVASLTPSSGASRSSITISGVGLTGVTAVKFSGGATAQFTVNSDTSITATIPDNAVTGPLTLSKANCADVQTVTFTVLPCITVTPTSQSFPVNGGTGSVTVNNLVGCNWTATSNASWITITSGTSGSSNGTVNFTVAANTSSRFSRTGTLTIATQTFTVTQAGCSFTIAPTSQSFTASGGTGSFAVTSSSGCAWTAAVYYDWINITAGSSGNGNGTVSFTVSPNSASQSRTGYIYLEDKTFSITQTGCSFSISPDGQSFEVAGGTGAVTVTASPGTCAWTATSSAAWITISSGAAGTGNGTVNFTVAPNQGLARTGTLTIAEKTFTVTQARSSAANGNLDPTFGNGGKVITNLGGYDEAHSIVIQPDGKIVVAGESNLTFALARYNNNGTLDTSFGSGGKVTTTIGNSYSRIWSVVIQTDGRIVAGGYGSGPFALARYNSNGSLDTSFGNGGRVTTTFTGYGFGSVYALALQPDGKIVAAGYGEGSSFAEDIIVARYNSNGSLDTSFGDGGKAVANINSSERALAVALQPDGKIVAAGLSGFSGGGNFVVLRYNANGSLDTSFGSSGKTITDFGTGSELAYAMALQQDGKIVLAGSTKNYSVALARYNGNGSLDSTFGSGGKVMTDFGGVDDAHGIAIRPDGKILIAGNTSNQAPFYDYEFLLARYNSDGSLDGTFGENGKVATDFSNHSRDFANAIALQSDGKIISAGHTEFDNFAIARHEGGLVCTFGIAPTSQNFTVAGGTGSVSVTAANGCNWTATSNANWITLNSGASGSGAGTVNFTVAANADMNPRTGTLSIAGQTFTITQAGSSSPPVINSLNPASALAGGAGFTLTVNGSGFVGSSVVRWNNTDRVTTFVSATQLTATISAADIANFGTAGVIVVNPAPSGESNTVNFTISLACQAVAAINPMSGSPGSVIAIAGTNFNGVSAVKFANNVTAQFTVVSATQINATVPATAVTGPLTISKPGCQDAQTASFTVTGNPKPVLESLNPPAAAVGGPGFLLTIFGNGFSAGSKVRWNGGDRATTFVSPTELRGTIFASDIGSEGTNFVTVFTPAPGGGLSNALDFVVGQPNPAPTISSLSPNQVEAGGAGFTLTVNGTGFVADSKVRWNNSNRTTTFVSATQLTAAITAADIASAGTASVAVFNPAPGGGTSGSLNFTVNPKVVCQTVSGINPMRGLVGSAVTVTGANLDGVTAVRFTGNATAQFTIVSATQITATVPSGAATGPITISKTGCPDVTTAAFTICSNITLAPASLPAGTANLAYSQTITASGGVGPYEFALSAGALPNGLTLSSGGTLTGSTAQSGAFNFTVRATDTNGCTGTQSYALTINACPTISLSPATLPNGVAGAAYDQTLSASPAGTYSFAVSAGALPAGLSLNATTGAITGTPTTAGTSNFTVTATGTGSCSGSQTYSLTINNPTPSVAALNPASVKAGSAGLTLTVNGANFVNGSVVRWNNADRQTTFIGATQLTAAISANDVASVGSANVAVFNPAPGGGLSNSVNLTITPSGYEADVAPRPNGSGDGVVTVTDWVQVGRFVAGLDTPAAGSEFQRADCAPRATLGDGQLTTTDWVQAGRYLAGSDAVTAAGGPAQPAAGGSLSVVRHPSSVVRGQPSVVRGRLQQAASNEQRTFSIELEARGDENALAFSLRFDSVRWRVLAVEPAEDARQGTLLANTKDAARGRIGLALALPAGASFGVGNREVARVRFASVAAAVTQADVPLISFADEPVARDMVSLTAERLTVIYKLRDGANDAGAATVVSAASFAGEELARGSIVAAFGERLAERTGMAATLPLPVTLGGTQVTVADSAGAQYASALFFVAPGQINFLLPEQAAPGLAAIRIVGGDGTVNLAIVYIADAAPSLFTANAYGQGVAAGMSFRLSADGTRRYEPLAEYNDAQARFTARPLVWSDDEQMVLALFGSGLRFHGNDPVTVRIGDVALPVLYAGPQGEYSGLDQLNVLVPRELAGRGDVALVVSLGGKTTNPVWVCFK